MLPEHYCFICDTLFLWIEDNIALIFLVFVEILVILITNKNIIWEWNFASRHYHRCMQNEWKDFNTDKICKIAIHHNRYDRERESKGALPYLFQTYVFLFY